MHVFSLEREQQWDPKHHVEKIIGTVSDGDVTVACWEPGQVTYSSLVAVAVREWLARNKSRAQSSGRGH
jgi:hypothetical protein